MQVTDTSAASTSTSSAAAFATSGVGGRSAGRAPRPVSHTRTLQEQRSENAFALVATARDLLLAVEQGIPHIRIIAHIDLTRTAVSPLDFQIRILSSIKSIKVSPCSLHACRPCM